jgi:hypothetical protein
MWLFYVNENLIKLQHMKTSNELKTAKVPAIRIDSSLEQYRDKVLFPRKLAKANEMLKTAKLPIKKRQG